VVLTFQNPDPVKNHPEPQHWSKPVSDPDPTPQIMDPARNFGYGSKNSFMFHVTNMLQLPAMWHSGESQLHAMTHSAESEFCALWHSGELRLHAMRHSGESRLCAMLHSAESTLRCVAYRGVVVKILEKNSALCGIAQSRFGIAQSQYTKLTAFVTFLKAKI
jgi:hypothetical protein